MSAGTPQNLTAISPELSHLLSALADDAISEAEFQRLDELLRGDSAGRRHYLRYVALCDILPEVIVPPHDTVDVAHGDLSQDQTAPGQTAPGLTLPKTGAQEFARLGLPHRLTARRAVGVAAAALILIAGLLWSFSTNGPRDQLSNSAPLSNQQRLSTSDSADSAAHVAVITDEDNAVWGAGTSIAGIGSALRPGTLTLESGRVEIDFACGAKVFLRGPAEFSLLSAARGKLHHGELSAVVPEGAEGFVIDTPSVEVVDLGTEFGVSVDRQGIADVHVFKGAVEARMTGADEAPGSLVRLETSETRRFVPAAIQPLDAKFDPASYPELSEPAHDEPQTHGAVRLLRHPPESVDVDKLESNDFMLLFEERTLVSLPKRLPVTFTVPGRYVQVRGQLGRLAAGTRVSSYLLHFDSIPVGGRARRLRLDGSITFPRPVLGVLSRGKQLVASDALLGAPGTFYGQLHSRGLDVKAKDDTYDIVTLSEDRRTLHVSFSVARSSDQLRILTEGAEE